jgi:hypothetical protein
VVVVQDGRHLSAAGHSPAALLAVAVVVVGMLAAAVATVAGAGCADPGRLVTRADGVVVLEGGCVSAGDLVVPGAPLATLDGRAPVAVRP